MAKLNAVILPAKITKNNKHKIRISVAHNGETKYLVTDIEIDANDTFKNGKLIKGNNSSIINAKLHKLLTKYQDTLDNIDYIESLSCGEVISLIKNGGRVSNPSIEDVYNLMIQNLRVKQSSIDLYGQQWRTLCKYIDKTRQMALLSSTDILSLENKLRKVEFKNSSIVNYMGLLKRLTNFAINNDLITFKRNPWKNYTQPKTEIRKAWLTVSELRAIRDYDIENKTLKFARDLFMLSFYMGGVNLVDIANMDFAHILKKNKVRYKRQKADRVMSSTHFIEYNLQPETREALLRIQKWKFFENVKPQKYRTVTIYCNKLYKFIGEDLGIDSLIYYSARKTFSQIAFEIGISSYVIDYILGHSVRNSGSCLYHYVFVTPEMASNAMRKVFDYIK